MSATHVPQIRSEGDRVPTRRLSHPPEHRFERLATTVSRRAGHSPSFLAAITLEPHAGSTGG